MIETSDLTKSFGNLLAVDGVDFAVEEGSFHSVIGPNGAGKSTLFNLITGWLAPTSGEVYFRGEEITGLSPPRIVQRGLARSFQIEDIFDGLTVAENITVAAQSLDDRRDSVWQRADSLESVNEKTGAILEDLDLAEQADQRAGDLSYGDRRKIEIGLAVATEPDLLLLDEPTAGMSRDEIEYTMELLDELIQERDLTVVLIEHDLELVMEASDVVTVLHDGRIIAEGRPSAIRTDPAVREAYIGDGIP